MIVDKSAFGDEFIWGVSTAAYQIEGAFDKSGKGPSIWDVFVRKKNKIFQNQHGDIACDFYNRYMRDLYLMYSLNIRHYRFSIAWSRIFPEGTGAINEDGIAFYNRLIDFSLELGITPWVTLYHWDLPQALENRGGWTNRDIINWFQEYVQVCVTRFGDRVKNWMILNEPMVFTGAGYFFGVHAPGRTGLDSFLAAVHHATLAQAHGAKVIKSLQQDSHVGTTFSCSHVEPFRSNDRDILAASRADALLNRLFIEPLLGMGYPTQDLKILRRIEKYMQPDDEHNMAFEMDFVGVQNYTREMISYAPFVPYLQAKIVPAEKRNVPLTAMKWEVYPPSLFHLLKKFDAYPNMPPLIVTENGAAFHDEVQEDQINDPERITYLQETIKQMFRAKQQGVNVKGYFVWTFMDNFEWAEGYHPRFGLVYVDFKTQQRTVKSSGRWYADFIK